MSESGEGSNAGDGVPPSSSGDHITIKVKTLAPNTYTLTVSRQVRRLDSAPPLPSTEGQGAILLGVEVHRYLALCNSWLELDTLVLDIHLLGSRLTCWLILQLLPCSPFTCHLS